MKVLSSPAWFFKKKVYLFDLDGTLYLGRSVLPGARELIESLRAAQKKVYFFTNNSSRSEKDYIRKLREMGFRVTSDQIIMSTHTLIAYLLKRKLRNIYLLGTPAMRSMLKSAGIQHDDRRPRAVVVGFDKTVTYQKFEAACRWVSKGLPYLVTHPDYFCPTDQGPEPDCGALAKVIELATKKFPLAVLGKPHPSMIEEAKRRSRVSTRDMVLIGDRLMTDIAMGRSAGVDSILVLSGESQLSDLKKSKIKPRSVVKSVAALRISR